MVKYLGPKTHDQELLSVFPFEFPNNASQLFKEGSKAMWNISERRKKIASLKFGSVCGGSPEVAGMRSWPKRCANGRVYRVCHLSTSPAFLGCQLNRGNFANVNVLPGLAGTFAFFQHHLCHLIMSPASSQVVARGRTVWNSVGSWSSPMNVSRGRSWASWMFCLVGVGGQSDRLSHVEKVNR